MDQDCERSGAPGGKCDLLRRRRQRVYRRCGDSVWRLLPVAVHRRHQPVECVHTGPEHVGLTSGLLACKHVRRARLHIGHRDGVVLVMPAIKAALIPIVVSGVRRRVGHRQEVDESAAYTPVHSLGHRTAAAAVRHSMDQDCERSGAPGGSCDLLRKRRQRTEVDPTRRHRHCGGEQGWSLAAHDHNDLVACENVLEMARLLLRLGPCDEPEAVGGDA